MLTKKVAGQIIKANRACKCGTIVPINPIDKKIKCHKCGAIVHENTEFETAGTK